MPLCLPKHAWGGPGFFIWWLGQGVLFVAWKLKGRDLSFKEWDAVASEVEVIPKPERVLRLPPAPDPPASRSRVLGVPVATPGSVVLR